MRAPCGESLRGVVGGTGATLYRLAVAHACSNSGQRQPTGRSELQVACVHELGSSCAGARARGWQQGAAARGRRWRGAAARGRQSCPSLGAGAVGAGARGRRRQGCRGSVRKKQLKKK
ncbi:hypothetical protein GQ55_6G112100 [Panicum hallii var. hallii]|uniref:Uncharacterized protein n=1 Tax=Panicum hallii var. hallii TaxID=1504633 RepID=A0A2T7D5N6_9POAL|nr:hypothetical protein GQ55_6G112100 [Panicum hallii var. hallii]